MTHARAPAMPLTGRGPAAIRSLPHAAFATVLAAVLACGVVIASLPSSWRAGPTGGAAVRQEPDPVLAEVPPATMVQSRTGARARQRCANCGVVESIRPVEVIGSLPAAFEFTVRLRDGTVRVSRTIGRGHWRAGDRIMLIGGDSSGQ